MPTLEITTMIGCPLQCAFCPQSELKSAYGRSISRLRASTTGVSQLIVAYAQRQKESAIKDKYLSLQNFKRILDKVPKHVRIDFAGMAEPWANNQTTDMLQFTLERGYKITIYSTLFGMSKADAERTIGLLKKYLEQLQIVCLHLPDANGNMLGWKPSAEYKDILSLFLEFGNRDLSHRITHEANNIVPSFQIMTMDGSPQEILSGNARRRAGSQ